MERIQRMLGNFVILFFVVIISLNVLATIQLFDEIIETQNNVKSIENKIEVFELGTIREANISEQKIIDFYQEISDKTDDAISRVITIVGLVAGVVSFFSLLLAFKAPHDIERRMDKLNQMIKETSISVDETKYQVAISSALAQKDKYESIKKLTSVIQKNPEKPDAYLMRGFLYDDIKKYDSAINDYNIARKQGCELAVYYNSIAIAYSNKGEEKKAIECYTKAINLVKDNASYYCNRACSYDELNQYEAALEDFAKAIELDEDFYEAYYNRNFTYEKLWRQENDRSKQQYYIKCRKADLDRAIELNPEDGGAQKLLKKFIEELTEKGFLPSRQEVIAQIDENIGDISVSQGDYLEAFEHYADAFNYHAIAYYIHNKDDHEESVDRISMKIVEIILNKKESDIIEVTSKKSRILPDKLAAIGCEFYKEGEKRSAEMVFTAVLPNSMAALNLAYMHRRKETKTTNTTVMDLLEMSDEKKSAVWCVNKALCYIDGDEETNNWHKAIEILQTAEEDVDAAVDWWSDVAVVGEKESNVVFLLMQFAKIYADSVTIDSRISMAEKDGYILPADLKPEPAKV